ncbi:peptidyl-prolyl cis-trans isomerase [Vitreoscilla stercoraria]|uniref:Peptidyl-prolyl cis-trans isomerase n=2 Tax=Vitreoscilla stercoraria TaxID=61 RepID=A0ABY4EBC1_VITST|nr:peptidyl-prolyl cis-trans isomerase [Vitreoscilla stercoraria]
MMKKSLFASLLLSVAMSSFAATPVRIETSVGNIDLVLDEKKAPTTVKNFVSYANKGFYNGTIFHRVIDGFMIQGGGFTSDMAQKPTDKPINNEASNGLKNNSYTIAMARTQAPHSATSQFFINTKNNDALNYRGPTPSGAGYAVFGYVSNDASKKVVDQISKTKTSRKNGHSDVPVTPIVIRKVTVLKTQ